MDPLSMLAGAALFATSLMLALYVLQLYTRDAGVVDLGWAAALGFVAIGFAICGTGDALRRLALLLIAVPWSFRLAYLLLHRLRTTNQEDGRYASLRRQWGERAQSRFALLFAANALFIVLFSIPLLMAAITPAPAGFPEIVGVALGLAAILGERHADNQLAQWRRQTEHKGKTCRAGLWRYSRHPNYFFEWLHWWAYVLLAHSWPYVAGALLGPIAMFVFLYRLTGIPHTERQALASRGDDYRAYQAETSPFFPWFPKKRVP